MMSKKELSSGEMDTVERSRTPTAVMTANGRVQTHEEAQVSVHDLSMKRLQSCRQASFAKTTDTLMSASVVKSHD